jgi:hypothetical protein
MRQARGQAASELALGLIVMVTILMFGIHFGEMGYLGAKVHEAMASTLWDSTAYQTHEITVWADSNQTAVPAAQTNSTRYADFDGRASKPMGNIPRLAMTQASPITVTCQPSGSYAAPGYTNLKEPGGISCGATADMDVINIGSHFLDDSKGFFHEEQKLRSRYSLCSTGRLVGGNCGNIQLLLGDNGLHQFTEQTECELNHANGSGCGNMHFFNAVQDSFNLSAQAAGMSSGYTQIPENWASGIIPDVPWGVSGFYLSFKGEDSFMQQLTNGDMWETNPNTVQVTAGQPYLQAHIARKNCAAGGYCYLGKFNCN